MAEADSNKESSINSSFNRTPTASLLICLWCEAQLLLLFGFVCSTPWHVGYSIDLSPCCPPALLTHHRTTVFILLEDIYGKCHFKCNLKRFSTGTPAFSTVQRHACICAIGQRAIPNWPYKRGWMVVWVKRWKMDGWMNLKIVLELSIGRGMFSTPLFKIIGCPLFCFK